MFLFGFGNLIYIVVLLINAMAILSEDRFLARVGMSTTISEPAFGGGSSGASDQSITSKFINLLTSVRTLMRIPLIVVNMFIILYEIVLG
ncbi:Yos1-like protein [Amylocarpus encephaloides]|uniref:Yos1-like protein n=1 Tax=Amylocarpus encephaloides TaxID=45428 RepID=A0A9P8CAZ5_9HELO|nr:Yos1-like protein [Amylocarpus encephaloides]